MRAVLMRGIGVVRMIFGTVRRFGVSLAGARGRCRWLIAALVASLVSVPLASAAAPIERVPAVGGHHRPPVGHAAFLESAAGKLALAVVQTLGEGAIQKTGSEAFGWVLEEFGLGNGQKNEIAAIREQLGEIQTGLTEIRAATVQLRAELAEGTPAPKSAVRPPPSFALSARGCCS